MRKLCASLGIGQSALLCGIGSLMLIALSGCNGSSGIPNLTEAAAPLPGKEVYSGPLIGEERYGHTATSLPDGTVLVVGGTDERHLTGLSSVEIFDQSARVDIGDPIPESVSGAFIDQDIDGNLMEMLSGGRFFHTANIIDDGKVLVIGGTTSILFGIANENSEIFDPETRTFSVSELQIDPDDDIEIPRVRHSVHELPNGKLLITGGQEALDVVIPGNPPITQDAYPTTETIEIFDPATLAFSFARDNQNSLAELTTSRGRGGHTTAHWAGFDGLLNTGDDVLGFCGGYMTLSALSLAAPEDLIPWNAQTTKLTSMDFYDATTGVCSLAAGLVLTRRVNDPIAINLGRDHTATPFGDPGMANIVILFGGDNDTACPVGADPVTGLSTDRSDLIVATYTGFGAANGVIFTRVAGGTMVNPAVPTQSNTHANGHELAILGCTEFNRARGAAVLMDMVRTYDNQTFVTSVVVAGGGIAIFQTPGGCVQVVDDLCGANQVKGFQLFDPFYDISLSGTLIPLDDPPPFQPWEFSLNATNGNPLGIRGTWLNFDAAIPDNSITGYADGADITELETVAMGQGRLMFTLTRIPGEDGLSNTLDDRVVAIGGTGSYLPFFGDDPLAQSCEIFLPPDAGVVAP